MMLSLVTILVSLLAVAHGNININPQAGPDGQSYFSTPLYCTYSGSLLLRTYYENIRASYTPRVDRDCCYLEDSRNQCCLSDEGECRCAEDITCGIPPTTTTTTTTTTTPTTTTTMPATTTTTMPTTTTTTPPTTTTTEPTTTTTTMATTTTTEPTTTTTPFTSLCPLAFRVLNGNPVPDDCPFAGLANITTLDATITSCNAVWAPATVNGVVKQTFVTSMACKTIIEQASAGNPPLEFDLHIGTQRYPLTAPIFNLVDGSDGVAFFDVDDRFKNLFSDLGPCQRSACPYNNDTMSGLVDTDNCKIVSWGSSEASLMQDGLYEVAITPDDAGCGSIPDSFGAANTQCYKTVSGENLLCSGDTGAPIYCQAMTNGEWIFMGVASFQPACDSSSEVKVLPYPG